MKFVQLIEYNMTNIFLEKSCTKYNGGTIPRSLSKNPNWVYLSINSLKVYTVCFCCLSSWVLSNYK